MVPPNCPDWSQPESADELSHVVLGMADFHRFTFRNAKHHIIGHGDIKTWHGKIFAAVVPLDYYAGNYRSDDPGKPCLAIDVAVGPNSGAAYAQVPDLMATFSSELKNLVTGTARYCARGSVSPIQRTRAVAQLAAFAIGSLIKIHPFINGNGRMSRLVANYVLHRFGYPLLHPHPYDRPVDQEYAAAAKACMRNDFRPMYRFILICLAQAIPS
jgi:fido (protein-threonine AMPylation protein)